MIGYITDGLKRWVVELKSHCEVCGREFKQWEGAEVVTHLSGIQDCWHYYLRGPLPEKKGGS